MTVDLQNVDRALHCAWWIGQWILWQVLLPNTNGATVSHVLTLELQCCRIRICRYQYFVN